MRIDNAYLTSLPLVAAGESAPTEEIVRRDGPEPVRVPPSLHTPSAELLQWAALVHQQPEVRPDAVERALQGLAEGRYHTIQAAERTADAMIHANE